jgi:hypothetical protein
MYPRRKLYFLKRGRRNKKMMMTTVTIQLETLKSSDTSRIQSYSCDAQEAIPLKKTMFDW